MKKTLIILFSIICVHTQVAASTEMLLSAPTFTKIVKSHGGVFGYDYVNTSQSNTNPQNVITCCAEPGFKRCRVQTSAISVPGDLNPTQLEEIDLLVNQKIKDTKTNGSFPYDSNFFVVYTFDFNVNNIDYIIYTKAEANQLGYEL